MEAEALTVVYLYLGIGAILLAIVMAITAFRKAIRVLEKYDILAKLMIGNEEDKQKVDEGGFGT